MSKTKAILLFCFASVFAAGVLVGAVARRATAPRRERHSWLSQELDLTPDQRDQMRDIWSDAMRGSREQQHQERRALREKRDQALQDLLSDEQKAEYEKILLKYEEGTKALDEVRKAAFDDAVQRTKAILNEEQRAKYEEMLKRGPRERHGGAPRPPFPSGGPDRPRRGGERGPDREVEPNAN